MLSSWTRTLPLISLTLLMLTAGTLYAQSAPNLTEAPIAGSDYAKSIGVAAHFDRVSSGVYATKETDPVLGAADLLTTYLVNLPAAHYRTKASTDTAFFNTVGSIPGKATTAGVAIPKGDYIFDLRRACTAPPQTSPKNTYTSVTASPGYAVTGPVTTEATATVCWVDASSTIPTGCVQFLVNGTAQTDPVTHANCNPINSDGHASMSLTLSDSTYPIVAHYESADTTHYYDSYSQKLQLLTSQPSQLGCAVVTHPNGYAGAPNEVGATRFPKKDLLGDSSVSALNATTQLQSLFDTLNSATDSDGYAIWQTIGWIEGPNEYNGGYNDVSTDTGGYPVWTDKLSYFAGQVETVATGESHFSSFAAFIAPSMSGYEGIQTSGPLVCVNTPCYNFGNDHAYPRPLPSTNLEAGIQAAISIAGSSAPIFQTEAGYHNAVNYTGTTEPKPVDTTAGGIYGPRTLAEYLSTQRPGFYSGVTTAGIPLMNFYELVDENTGTDCDTDPESNFGLLTITPGSGSTPASVSPKPIYTALQRTLGYMSDPVASHSLASKSFYLDTDGDSTVHHLLLRKGGSTAAYYLMLWREVSVYDAATKADLTVTPTTVQLNMPGYGTATTYAPSSNSHPTITLQTNGNYQLDVAGEVIIVKLAS